MTKIEKGAADEIMLANGAVPCPRCGRPITVQRWNENHGPGLSEPMADIAQTCECELTDAEIEEVFGL